MKKRYGLLLALAFLYALGCNSDPVAQPKGDLEDIPYAPQPYVLSLPAHFPVLEVPADNPTTQEGVQLGRRLFYDPILSADGSMSCATCHLPAAAFTDNSAVSIGIDGIAGQRSAMSLLNVGFYYNGLQWAGEAKSLEEQALLPVENPIELHSDWDEVVAKLQAHPDYPARFRRAFGIANSSEIDRYLVAKAIAQFERILISAGSKYDRVLAGQAFFSEQELLGYDLFFDISPEVKDAECGHCHNGALMTTNQYINNGLTPASSFDDFPDPGRGGVTQRPQDKGTFRVPTLRNIFDTAPYMHDGRFGDIDAVLDHYSSGGHYAPNLDPLIYPTELTETERQALKAFLLTLQDESYLDNPDVLNPF